MHFVCRYGTPEGRVLTETLQASDTEAMRRELERRGCHVFEVRQRGVPLRLELPWSGRRRKIPPRDFLAFNQELAALLKAGLPLLQALDIMLGRMEDPVLREVVTEVRDDVKSGAELSDAFAKHGRLFPTIYASSLKAGERSGELESVLRRFIRYQTLVLETRRKVVSALVYPAVLISLSIVMVAVLAIYVVPSFSVFYAELDAELPLLTRITLGISYWLRDHLLWILLALVAGWVAVRAWGRSPEGQRALHHFRLRLPLIGGVFHYHALSQFSRSLATLVAGGIPLVQALEIATAAVTNSWVRSHIEPAIDEVREGQAFYESLERSTVFPGLVINMIQVGEATGGLDEMLNHVGDFLDGWVETRTQRLLALVEPMLLIVMGTIVSLILVSIYLPMFSAFSQVQ